MADEGSNQTNNPGFIASLMNLGIKNKPIVFIMEDSDAVIAKRQSDNMSSISSLLNLGDGILGHLFRVHLLCSCNSGKMDFDPALVRRGRLCRQVEISSLNKEHSEQIFKRLTGDENKKIPGELKNYTLADVYHMARVDSGVDNIEEIEIKKHEKNIGF